MVRGSLGTLRSSGGNYASATEACLADNRPDTFWVHAESPSPGEAQWYLVREAPGGTYDEGVAGQSGSRDAEIASSGNGCP